MSASNDDTAGAASPAPPPADTSVRRSTSDDNVDEHTPRRSWLPDVLGILWVVVAAGCVLGPALAHGSSLGPYDILQQYGLNTTHIKAHNTTLGDQIRLFIPWTNLVWTQVHHGHIPLWNQYNVLGMPLAFNWESAPLSLPVIVGYLFPVHLAFTVQLIVTVLVAGTGAYVLGRVLHLGVIGSVMAATMFELSGPFIGWLGWPLASVMSWGGWLLAVAVLILRGQRRRRAITLGAVVLAFSFYAGDPEGTLLLGLAIAIFCVVVLALRLPLLRGSGPIRRPITDFVIMAVTGVLLAAPLLLPGLQVASGSNRTAVGPSNGPQNLPLKDLIHLVFQSFDGLPLAGSRWFGYSNYEETAAYVGVIGLVLALTALVVRGKRPEILALGVVVVATGSLVFLHPVVHLLDRHVVKVYWVLAMTPMVLAISVLAGVGVDVIVRTHRDPTVRQTLGIGFTALGLLVAMLFVVGRGSLPRLPASVREKSFIWPAIEVVVGLAVVGALVMFAGRTRRTRPGSSWGMGHTVATALLLCETVFLITVGAPMLSSSPNYLAPTPGISALQKAVGTSIVGFGVPCSVTPRLGILENVNDAYAVQEMAEYDPMIPEAYYTRDWQNETGEPGGVSYSSNFCPVFQTASLARRFGVGYVLELQGFSGPVGSVYDMRVGNEKLYKIPGAAAATLVALPAGGGMPGVDANGTPVSVTHPNPSAWKLETNSARTEMLRLRLTNIPGWHASIDGKPLKLLPYDAVMLQARVPAGSHTIELSYWPTRFSVGLVLAAGAVVGLVVVPMAGRRRRRRVPWKTPDGTG